MAERPEKFSPAKRGWLIAWHVDDNWSVGVVSKLTAEGRATHARVWCVGLGVPSFFREYPVETTTAMVAGPHQFRTDTESVARAFIGAGSLDTLHKFFAPWRAT